MTGTIQLSYQLYLFPMFYRHTSITNFKRVIVENSYDKDAVQSGFYFTKIILADVTSEFSDEGHC